MAQKQMYKTRTVSKMKSVREMEQQEVQESQERAAKELRRAQRVSAHAQALVRSAEEFLKKV